jgi:hypothetical protein
MKKLDIPCGEGNIAIILEEQEIHSFAEFLSHERIIKQAVANCAVMAEKEFNLIAGLIKETPEEKPYVVPEGPGSIPF